MKHTILKFRYFFCFLILLGCGDKTSSDNKKAPDTVVDVAKEEEAKKEKVIVFFGDSLTAGYGLSTEEAFPALIQQMVDSLGLNYSVVNAGLSGETTASGKNRLGWVLRQKVDIFVLELGANDGLRGIPLSETRQNLQDIISEVKKGNPDTRIVLAGMQIPPNMGPKYTQEFRTIFPDISEENSAVLIPFLLDGVAGIPSLNLEDGIHPTEEGHKIVAANVWKTLYPLLEATN